MWFDLVVAELEELSREDLIVLVRAQSERIAGLEEANKELAAKLARLEHLLSRNSGNSSVPPSRDDDPGRSAPKPKRSGGRGSKPRGKQPGAPGANLAWRQDPDDRVDRFPQGRCECGTELAQGRDLGIVDQYQQHEIPPVAVKVTQYDQHAVACGCGQVHTAARPEGARSGPVGYGPNLQALAVYLLAVQFLPVGRVLGLLESLTGTAPSAGFVHGMLARAAGLLDVVDKRIRALLTLAHVVAADETPLRVGPAGSKKYLLVACTELYTHYLLGGRDLDTFKALAIADLAAGSVIVHDRYQNYDAAPYAHLLHQLCTAHLVRDLETAVELYPDEHWPTQIRDALRGLIHEANTARAAGADQIDPTVKDELVRRFRHGVLVGLKTTASHGDRPGERKTRLLLEELHDRPDDVLRFTTDLRVPATSNQAERDLRPSKIQQNISGRLTSEDRTRDRFQILGYLSTATKHGLNQITVLRQAILGRPWMPELPATV
ncbi:IS66 family transposase [Natronosporangium hydrolyticum]|uniref:IS66 family transposase n=1 Tax=Natronosporangium hydrolyticum TaxID=2811111 RepID=A0A895Y7R5_9ACTN|nr:IS66 family transposase [Natronosporangium hydrolyticum]QSB13757.1 IS66 family transposase [Natronosporangium hydrolyticum]